MLTRKQKMLDDFAAVLDEMVARRYTSPDRLANIGGSNGGLLMGAIDRGPGRTPRPTPRSAAQWRGDPYGATPTAA